jgi:addiction module HigA family antidote
MEMYNPCHPGEILREEYLKPLGLTVTEASLKLGITRKTLSAIINERAGISPAMALRLAKAFKTTPDLWIDMQAQYDLWLARQKTNIDNVQVMYG